MENESSIRRRRTPAERAQIPDQYHQSGLTQKVFAAQAGISCSALSSWLRPALTNSDSHQPQFVPVPNLLSAGRSSAVYRLPCFPGFASVHPQLIRENSRNSCQSLCPLSFAHIIHRAFALRKFTAAHAIGASSRGVRLKIWFVHHHRLVCLDASGILQIILDSERPR
jgi:hypothetical protein